MKKPYNIKSALGIILILGIMIFVNPVYAITYPEFSEIASIYAD